MLRRGALKIWGFGVIAVMDVIFPLRGRKTVVIETRAPEGLCEDFRRGFGARVW